MSEEKENRSVFDKLNAKDVSAYTERKKTGGTQLTYLSWANAWKEVKKAYPDANYEIRKFDNNLPYVHDPETGYMVFTSVTIEGQTHEMWLPVMDGANKAMKSEPYTYQVIKWSNGRRDGYIDKTVEAATMFDVNKTIMRCLTKNLAMFGLGLYIYAGEDLPEDSEDAPTKQHPRQTAPNAKAIETAKYIAEQSIGAWGKEKGQAVYNALKEHYGIVDKTGFDPEKTADYMKFIVSQQKAEGGLEHE